MTIRTDTHCRGCATGVPTKLFIGLVVHCGSYEDLPCTEPTWQRIVRPTIPRCDLCDKPAHFTHPLGGIRCRRCRRPEAP